MRSPARNKWIPAAALLAAWACKQPSVNNAQLLEAGGTAATWSMAATLDTNGTVYVDAQGGDSEQDQYQYTGVQLQVANAPDGQVYNSSLTDKKYFPLQTGDADVTFNVLVTTRGNHLCYVNGARLDGTGYAVACKSSSAADASPDDRLRAALADACQRLANQRIDGHASSDYYARYDRDRNRMACTCLNGRTRDLEYAPYATRYVTEFEEECKRRLDGTNNNNTNVNPNTAGLTVQQKADLIRRECDAVAAGHRGVTCSDTYALCGEASRRRFDYDGYNGQAATFRTDCSRETDTAANPTDADPSSELGQLQRACTAELGGTLTSDRRGCDCPGAKRLMFDAYLGRNDAFGEACL